MILQNLSGNVLSEPYQVQPEDILQIKSLKNPPLMDLTPGDIYIRRVRLAGDVIDAYGGRFRTNDLPRLLKMTQGLPLLIGHRKDTLGVARFFNGAVEGFDGAQYIVPRFYWLTKHSGAEDLKLSIDGGIVSEASISFSFKRPSCSICGEDIRACVHRVGKTYMGAAEPCFYYYDEIVRVNEGSLVYQGAEPGTGFQLNRENQRFSLKDKLQIKFRGRLYTASPVG